MIPQFILPLFLVAMAVTRIAALDSFRSIDNRLPNPDRPYDMTSGTVSFGAWPMALDDLQFKPSNPSQLDIPALNEDGKLEFDSLFDIKYSAVVSFGEGPSHPVSGSGTVHALGVAPAGTNPQVFDTKIIQLDLVGLSSNSDIKFRESPSLDSHGVTTRENLCPPCASPVTYWRISSFFDVFAEVSFNGGDTWIPGDKMIHIEQVTNPAADSDFNRNGLVDAPDYLAWRKGNGPMYTTTDYNLWRENFGQATTTGSATMTPGAIPEPSTCWLIAIAAISFVLSLRPRSWRRAF